ncbi:MAG: hypothetical protein KKE30_00915 [Gammaproteobacteria bacterium]|nr:hypothetical protein [Gammaproteobacteria bacterium]MBU1556411.1 hypothetical protein [Gammaproteobacteria bacterium]MBU2072005.1 hypothetical protein [Gammaproteobacteria bacterium]MBU2183910.1 hypothetical protein [Gammaproteobacteria bacterium]MBU2203336.1 hypothetical protein [Gammaproteobacteria bacterium]
MKKYVPLIIFFVSCVTQAQSLISLKSDQGDWIGYGQEHELTGEFSHSIGKRQISINHESGFNFLFVSPDNRELERGAYLFAERAPFRGPMNPGMSVGSPGRGCNTISGEFYIYEIDYSEANPVLAMDFIQYCGFTTAKLTGSIRLNSDIQIPYPLPFPVIYTSSSSVLEGDTFVVSGSKTIAKTSNVKSYLWEQISGPEVNIASITEEATEVVVLDNIELGGEKITLKLTVTDDLGQLATAEYPISLRSKSDPQTYFTMSSEAGDYIGAGRDWFYDLTTSVISASRNYDNGVSISISGSEYWSADFAAPDDVQLEIGEYDNAERFPFQAPGVAGLSVYGNGRGCNINYGSFKVTKLLWEGGKPTEFKASFLQHCESTTAPLLSGEIALNALHESVPQAIAGDDIEINEHEIVNLNGSASQDNIGTIVAYSWTTMEDGVTIQKADESRANFIAPSLPNKVSSINLEVSLLVTDDEGYKAVDRVNVKVLANNSGPMSNDDSFDVLIGGTRQLTPLANDSDPDGNIAVDTIDVTKAPTFGTITINSQGVIEYTHTGATAVEDNLTYTVRDNDGAISNEATIKIQIKAQNVEPDKNTSNSSSGGALSYWLIILAVMSLALKVRFNRRLS